MKKHLRLLFQQSISIILFLTGITYATEPDREINNLRAFAKLYGYIRFFHPSDEAAKLDWDKFAVYGVAEIRNIKNTDELINKLKKLFLPIAPMVSISSIAEPLGLSTESSLTETSELKIIASQHYGVWLTGKRGYFKSIRTTLKSKVMDKDTLRISEQKDNSKYKNVQNYRLFENIPKAFECYKAKIDSGIYCNIPLTLLFDGSNTLGKNVEYQYDSLVDKINNKNTEKVYNTNDNVRLADIIITWNIIQHFSPYFDTIDLDWDKVLDETLREAINEKSDDTFLVTLSKMMARLQDGHTFTSYKNENLLDGLLIRVGVIQNRIVVVDTKDTLFHKGDVIEKLDGESAVKILHQIEQREPGSKQWKEYMACFDFGKGVANSPVELELIRDEYKISIHTKRISKPADFYRTILTEFNYPPIKKIAEGIYYVHLLTINQKLFDDSLKALSNAKGVVFDLRMTSALKANTGMFNPGMILWKLTNKEIETDRFYTPVVIYPDRVKMSFVENVYPIYPDTPYIKANKVFLVDPAVLSHFESFLGPVKQFHLGEIVGSVTAGVNGLTNPVILPGGFQTMFTGVKVLHNDGSQHHLLGIKPDYVIERTIQAVKEGRDEYLEKAIEVLEQKMKN